MSRNVEELARGPPKKQNLISQDFATESASFFCARAGTSTSRMATAVTQMNAVSGARLTAARKPAARRVAAAGPRRTTTMLTDASAWGRHGRAGPGPGRARAVAGRGAPDRARCGRGPIGPPGQPPSIARRRQISPLRCRGPFSPPGSCRPDHLDGQRAGAVLGPLRVPAVPPRQREPPRRSTPGAASRLPSPPPARGIKP